MTDTALPPAVIRPACRPDVPARVIRRLARRHTVVSGPHDPPGRAGPGRPAGAARRGGLGMAGEAALGLGAVSAWAGTVSLLLYVALDKLDHFHVLSGLGAGSLWLLAAGLAGGLLAGLLSLLPQLASAPGRWLVRRNRPAFVDPAELDEDCRILLWRAQRAIDVALGSEVAAAGRLDHLRAGLALPHREWDLARRLREISSLQAAIPPAGGLGPLAAARASAQRGILRQARAESAGLVDALERYAAQVGRADEAFRDEQRRQRGVSEDSRRALQLASRDHRYLDLQAGAAALPAALDEVASLTAEAEILACALRAGEPDGEAESEHPAG